MKFNSVSLSLVSVLAVLCSVGVRADNQGTIQSFPIPYGNCDSAWDNMDPPLDPCSSLCKSGSGLAIAVDPAHEQMLGCNETAHTQTCECVEAIFICSDKTPNNRIDNVVFKNTPILPDTLVVIKISDTQGRMNVNGSQVSIVLQQSPQDVEIASHPYFSGTAADGTQYFINGNWQTIAGKTNFSAQEPRNLEIDDDETYQCSLNQ